jgi:hypothetical protein
MSYYQREKMKKKTHHKILNHQVRKRKEGLLVTSLTKLLSSKNGRKMLGEESMMLLMFSMLQEF